MSGDYLRFFDPYTSILVVRIRRNEIYAFDSMQEWWEQWSEDLSKRIDRIDNEIAMAEKELSEVGNLGNPAAVEGRGGVL
jgi:hypothetical protein